MSISASIEIYLSESMSAMTILHQLETYGWTYNDHGGVTFLPVGDHDDYHWQHSDVPKNDLEEIIRAKESQGEVIGVAMTWKDTNIGGTLLICEKGTFLMSLDINRKLIEAGGGWSTTDVNWYITRLIPAFGSLVESVSYQEHV